MSHEIVQIESGSSLGPTVYWGRCTCGYLTAAASTEEEVVQQFERHIAGNQ